MKTTSLSVAYKKHIYNQNNHLKSEDTSAFDPTELAGAKEGSSPWSETTSMLFRPQHGILRVPSSEPKEEGFAYEVGEPLLSK